MPTFLGHPFSPDWRGSPPGMSMLDSQIWYRWLDKHQKEITQVFYNVRVGGGSPPLENNNPDDILSWLMLTMLRIDAVVETAQHVLICELRPNAGRSLYGALMIYKQLWSINPAIEKPFFPLGITDNVTSQIRAIFELNNLRLEVV